MPTADRRASSFFATAGQNGTSPFYSENAHPRLDSGYGPERQLCGGALDFLVVGQPTSTYGLDPDNARMPKM